MITDYLQDRTQFAIKDNLRRAKKAAEHDRPDLREHYRNIAHHLWALWTKLLGDDLTEQEKARRELIEILA